MNWKEEFENLVSRAKEASERQSTPSAAEGQILATLALAIAQSGLLKNDDSCGRESIDEEKSYEDTTAT